MDDRASEKKDRLLAALGEGMVMVHLDARRPGVLVPRDLKCESHLRLHLSYRFDPPDLSVGEWGIRSTLSFSGKQFTVAIPWAALFAITSKAITSKKTHEFWMFPEDIPIELTQIPPPTLRAGARPPLVVRPGALREVNGERKSTDGEDDEAPRGRPNLKLIKS